jgi:hypothetical protein
MGPNIRFAPRYGCFTKITTQHEILSPKIEVWATKWIYIYTHHFWLAEVKKSIVELQNLTIKKPGKITI